MNVDAKTVRKDVLARLKATGPVGARMLDRALGCLLGGAAGDALGAAVEFMSRPAILRDFGPGGIRDFVPVYGRAGAITDDTQMTLFTAEGLLRAWVRTELRGIGPVFDSVTGRAYGRWLLTQGERPGFAMTDSADERGWLITNRALFARRSPGGTCLSALRDKRAPGDAATNDSKGCGGVMRVAPVGLLGAALQPGGDESERDRIVFDLGCKLAGLTHGHPSGRLPAGYLAVLVMGLATDLAWNEAHKRASRQLATASGAGETEDLLDEAMRLAMCEPGKVEHVEALGEGWVAEEALAISVYCALGALRQGASDAETFEEAVALAVNHGGDSDSTGSITGNILGAALGAESVPYRWLKTLELKDAIKEVAEDLATVRVWVVDVDDETGETNYWWDRYPGA